MTFDELVEWVDENTQVNNHTMVYLQIALYLLKENINDLSLLFFVNKFSTYALILLKNNGLTSFEADCQYIDYCDMRDLSRNYLSESEHDLLWSKT